eukprot:12126459-Karenia_brevis.AAC.1
MQPGELARQNVAKMIKAETAENTGPLHLETSVRCPCIRECFQDHHGQMWTFRGANLKNARPINQLNSPNLNLYSDNVATHGIT